MNPATELKPKTYNSISGKLKNDFDETQKNINDHKDAAKHLELAAQYHREAAWYHESGNHREAEERAFVAQGHELLAGQNKFETSLVFSW